MTDSTVDAFCLHDRERLHGYLCLTAQDRPQKNILLCLGSSESKEFMTVLQTSLQESRIAEEAEKVMYLTHH